MSLGKRKPLVWSETFRWVDMKWAIAGSILAVVAAIVAISLPMGLLAGPAALGIWIFIQHPWARAVFFMFGAVFVFQTSEGLSLPKLAYLAGVTFAVLISLARMKSTLQGEWARTMKPALIGAGLLAGWVTLVTLPLSVGVLGVAPTDWARDAITYLLISAGVVIGLDAAGAVPLKWARALTMTVGAVSAYGFASVWIQLRGFGSGEVERGFLSSIVAMTIALALAFVLALSGRGLNMWWLAAGIALLMSVLVTGTRTGLILAVVLVGIVGSVAKMRVAYSKALAGIVLCGLGLITILPIAGAFFSSEDFVRSRFEGIIQTFQAGFGQDRSGAIRERAYGYSTDIWSNHQFFGQGLGVVFPNPNPGGVAVNFSLDTPMTYMAKFGLLGTIVIVAALILIVIACVKLPRDGRWVLEQTAVRGAVLVWLCLLPLGAPTEDKGFAIAICLAVLLVGSARRGLAESGRGLAAASATVSPSTDQNYSARSIISPYT